jgi:hypothetical protein
MSENTATGAAFIVCLLYFIARIGLENRRHKKATESRLCDCKTSAQKQAEEEIKRNVAQALAASDEISQ